MQTTLLFVSLALCLSAEMWTNSEYIAGAGECGDDWQEEWGETDKTMAEEFQNEM